MLVMRSWRPAPSVQPVGVETGLRENETEETGAVGQLKTSSTSVPVVWVAVEVAVAVFVAV